MVLYEGNCNNKTQIGCNGDTDGCDGYSSQITADVSGGNLYLVRVGGWDGSAILLGLPGGHPDRRLVWSGAHREYRRLAHSAGP